MNAQREEEYYNGEFHVVCYRVHVNGIKNSVNIEWYTMYCKETVQNKC
jgi:hypothetical protein